MLGDAAGAEVEQRVHERGPLERVHQEILDATHLCDESFWESLEVFRGPVWASHSNCRALVPHQRQFSDEQLKAIFARDGVIGAALDPRILQAGIKYSF